MVFKIISIIIIIVLLTRLLLIKREMKNITRQLNRYNNRNTNKKLDIALIDKDIERLAGSINRHIDIHRESDITRQQAEEELKGAIANIAHDIRTPLTSIIGYIQIAKKNNIDGNKKIEYIDIALNRAKSLQIMLNELFSLSVIENSEYELELENINLNNILYEVITAYYEKLIENNIEPNINIKQENLIIIGNKNAVNRVIENLITNLIKYSKGNEEILLYQKYGKAALTIVNSIENLKQEDVNILFNRFYKKDESRSCLKSTGLGLAIAKGLMEKMDGEIDAYIKNEKLYIVCKWKIFN